MALALLASAAVHGMVLSTQFVQINPRLFEDPNLPMEVVLVNAKSTGVAAQPGCAGAGQPGRRRQYRRGPAPEEPVARQQQIPDRQRGSRLAGTRGRTRTAGQSPVDASCNPNGQVQNTPAGRPAHARAARHRRQPAQPAGARNGPVAGAHLAAVGRIPEAPQARLCRRQRQGICVCTLRRRLGHQGRACRQRELSRGRTPPGHLRQPQAHRVDLRRRPHRSYRCGSLVRLQDSRCRRDQDRRTCCPYAAFPDDMRKKADILSITRTWTFTRSDQLVGTD